MNVQSKSAEDTAALVAELGRRAREAAIDLRNASTEAKNRALPGPLPWLGAWGE